MKKGDISPFIIEIIGSMIVVGLVIILFSGFAGPFLDFLVDYENTKNFNKFTATMSKACTEGAETYPYISFSSNPSQAYMIALLDQDFQFEIEDMNVCSYENYPCVTENGLNRLDSCTGQGNWCWCLLKVSFKDTEGGGYTNCVNYNYNILTVERTSPLDAEGAVVESSWDTALLAIDDFNTKMGEELTNPDVVEKINILQCVSIDELNCRDSTTDFPIFPSAYGGNVTVLFSPLIGGEDEDGDFIYNKSIFFDSVSMQRPVAVYGPDYYMNFYSHPEVIVGAFDITANNTYSTDCPRR